MKTDAGTIFGWQQVASGLAAVWAKGNTRDDLFAAMERKEVYATTGSRMTVRFFGGWDFNDQDLNSREPAFAGYQRMMAAYRHAVSAGYRFYSYGDAMFLTREDLL